MIVVIVIIRGIVMLVIIVGIVRITATNYHDPGTALAILVIGGPSSARCRRCAAGLEELGRRLPMFARKRSLSGSVCMGQTRGVHQGIPASFCDAGVSLNQETQIIMDANTLKSLF